MARYVLLIRGINVGGNKMLPMADLRTLLAGLGYTDVVTLLQSGNAVFAAADADPKLLGDQIEGRIKDEIGMSVRCLIRTRAELRAVIEGNPLSGVATDGSRMLALFLSETPDSDKVAAHDPQQLAPGEVRLGDRVIYQWCPDGIAAAPPVGLFVERHLKVAVTARNWNTVTKLAELIDR